MKLKKVKKSQKTGGYGRDKGPEIEKLKKKKIRITKTRQNLKQRKNRKAVRISMKSVQRAAIYLWKAGFKKKKSFEVGKKRMIE